MNLTQDLLNYVVEERKILKMPAKPIKILFQGTNDANLAILTSFASSCLIHLSRSDRTREQVPL